jgi:translation elongation factor EF-G
MSLILSNTARKSYLIHFIDTPGHINFVDEVASAVRLVDGILLVVDVVEGVCEYYLSKERIFILSASLWLAPNSF